MKKYQQKGGNKIGGNRNAFNVPSSDMVMNEFDSISEVPMSAEYADNFAGPSSRPFNSFAGPSSRPFDNYFASSSNSFAGPSKPRNEQSSSQQQRRRPKKDNKFDAT